MLLERQTLSKSHKSVKALLGATFPSYRGRKVYLSSRESLDFGNAYWDEGSRSTYLILNRETGDVERIWANDAPWSLEGQKNRQKREIALQEIIAEHVIFCGKDAGIRFHVHPQVFKEVASQMGVTV